MMYISVPADPILIYDEEGRERITFVGPYTEHQDTKITCKAYGGREDVCRWLSNSQSVWSTAITH